ncbi:MAG: hypothetical protein IJG65_06175 [Synergistaceae bacterium]|nr:hypothetical protein [Synergistaceae bacterium]
MSKFAEASSLIVNNGTIMSGDLVLENLTINIYLDAEHAGNLGDIVINSGQVMSGDIVIKNSSVNIYPESGRRTTITIDRNVTPLGKVISLPMGE